MILEAHFDLHVVLVAYGKASKVDIHVAAFLQILSFLFFAFQA